MLDKRLFPWDSRLRSSGLRGIPAQQKGGVNTRRTDAAASVAPYDAGSRRDEALNMSSRGKTPDTRPATPSSARSAGLSCIQQDKSFCLERSYSNTRERAQDAHINGPTPTPRPFCLLPSQHTILIRDHATLFCPPRSRLHLLFFLQTSRKDSCLFLKDNNKK